MHRLSTLETKPQWQSIHPRKTSNISGQASTGTETIVTLATNHPPKNKPTQSRQQSMCQKEMARQPCQSFHQRSNGGQASTEKKTCNISGKISATKANSGGQVSAGRSTQTSTLVGQPLQEGGHEAHTRTARKPPWTNDTTGTQHRRQPHTGWQEQVLL